MRLVLSERVAFASAAGIVATLATTIAFGVTYACIGMCAWALMVMVALYRRSGDALDPSAALFLASFVFVLGPMAEIALSGEMADRGFYSAAIQGVTVSADMFARAEVVVAGGMLALTLPMLLVRSRRRAGPGDALIRCVPRRVWIFYGGFVTLTAAFVLYSFGGISGAAAIAFDPVARDQSGLRILSGLYGFLFVCCVVTAYYAAQRMPRPSAKLALFIPVLPLILPAANRGSLITAVLIGLAAAFSLRGRQVYLGVLAMVGVFPFVSILLLSMRFILAEGDVPTVIQEAAYQSFLTEATMAPAMAYVIEMLHSGRIDYVYGTDVLLLFIWFVPRILWAGKPLPLDYRLNEELGMNYGTAYGTPISLFGGAYINFTPFLYGLFLMGIAVIALRLHHRWKNDRLMAALIFTLVIDLVRVGDITREVWTFLISVGAVVAVRYVLSPSFSRLFSTRTVWTSGTSR